MSSVDRVRSREPEMILLQAREDKYARGPVSPYTVLVIVATVSLTSEKRQPYERAGHKPKA